MLVIVEYIILTRFIRFFILLTKWESFKVISKSLYEFAPFFVDLFGMLLIAFFFFSALGEINPIFLINYILKGVHLFGGRLNNTVLPLLNEDEQLYIYNNFNDFYCSLITLFELLIVNNWQVIVKII